MNEHGEQHEDANLLAGLEAQSNGDPIKRAVHDQAGRAYPAERYAPELADLADERHADAEGWQRYLEGHQAIGRWLHLRH